MPIRNTTQTTEVCETVAASPRSTVCATVPPTARQARHGCRPMPRRPRSPGRPNASEAVARFDDFCFVVLRTILGMKLAEFLAVLDGPGRRHTVSCLRRSGSRRRGAGVLNLLGVAG